MINSMNEFEDKYVGRMTTGGETRHLDQLHRKASPVPGAEGASVT